MPKFHVYAWALLTVFAAAAIGVPWASAQEPDVDEILTIDESSLITFRSDVEEVSVPVVVQGPRGEYVHGLEAFDFTVYDNDKKQEITGFDVSFRPISLVLCVQSSDRVDGTVDPVRETAVLFTDMVLGEHGEAAVFSFDSRINLLQDFTDDADKIHRALQRFLIGRGGIRVSDCVYEGIRLLVREPEDHKRVVVVISEGQDNGSTINLGETLRTAQLYNVQVYPIYLSTLKARLKNPPMPPSSPFPPGINPLPAPPGAAATPTTRQQMRFDATPNIVPLVIDLVIGVKNVIFKDALEVLSTGTGGDHYKPMTSDGLQEAIIKIGEDLRSQYLLSYRPNNLNESGIFHRIRVEVPYDNAKVRARPGYFFGPRPIMIDPDDDADDLTKR